LTIENNYGTKTNLTLGASLTPSGIAPYRHVKDKVPASNMFEETVFLRRDNND